MDFGVHGTYRLPEQVFAGLMAGGRFLWWQKWCVVRAIWVTRATVVGRRVFELALRKIVQEYETVARATNFIRTPEAYVCA